MSHADGQKPISKAHSPFKDAKGDAKSVAVIDIGSNSLRVVVYDRLVRSMRILLNDRVVCELGRGVSRFGYLDIAACAIAIEAMQRFKVDVGLFNCRSVIIFATAAVREAKNGVEFIKTIENIWDHPIKVLSGEQEALLAGLGVVGGFYRPDGVCGDFGGGSLELCDIKETAVDARESYSLGSLRLATISDNKPKRAAKIVGEQLASSTALKALSGRRFYAVGGTWRNFALAHMITLNYPLPIIHGYAIAPEECLDFCAYLMDNTQKPDNLTAISATRRRQLPFGAATLRAIIKVGKPDAIVFSTHGVRQGIFYDQLSAKEQAADSLLAAANDLAASHARSSAYGQQLLAWVDQLVLVLGLEEGHQETRLRHAACLLGDLDWWLHPDYTGAHRVSMVAHSAFGGIDHAGRVYLAIANYVSYEGRLDDDFPQELANIASHRLKRLAIIAGLAIRFANAISFLVPGLLPQVAVEVREKTLIVKLPQELAIIASDRMHRRLNSLAKAVKLKSQLGG